MKSQPETETIITVPWQRLDHEVFGKAGDITAAYSCDKKDKARTFKHDGKLFTNMGGGDREAYCYQLLPYTDEAPAPVQYSHEGEVIKVKGTKYRLGPKIKFIPTDRTVPEWREHLRVVYKEGGHFTSEKTYHEVLLHCYDGDTHRRRTATPNELTAVKLELDETDYSKWVEEKPEPKPQPKAAALVQTELAFT